MLPLSQRMAKLLHILHVLSADAQHVCRQLYQLVPHTCAAQLQLLEEVYMCFQVNSFDGC